MAVYYVGTILQSGDLKVMLHNDGSFLCFVYLCGVLLGYSNKCDALVILKGLLKYFVGLSVWQC